MKKLKPYVYIAPVLILLIGVFAYGIIIGVLQSFGYFPTVGMTELTLHYYKEVLTSKSFKNSLSFSLYVAFVSSIIAIILGVLLAYAIYKLKGKKTWIESIYQVPIAVPHIISALLVYSFFSQTGIIPRILYGVGLIDEIGQFPSLLYSKNGAGIIIAYLWKEIPFVALTTYAILGNMSEQLSNVAKNLGASSRQAFFHVILPLLFPTILSTFVIIFAFSFGAYEVPLLLGPTSPRVLAVQAYVEYTNPSFSNRPYAMVYNTLITVIALFLTWIYYRLFNKTSNNAR